MRVAIVQGDLKAGGPVLAVHGYPDGARVDPDGSAVRCPGTITHHAFEVDEVGAPVVSDPVSEAYEAVTPADPSTVFVAVTTDAGAGWTWDPKAGFTAPPAPPASTKLDFLGFLALFSASEQAAIVEAADPRIKVFCLMAAGANVVDLADPRTVGGVELLESLALIAKGRAAQVLAGDAPPAA